MVDVNAASVAQRVTFVVSQRQSPRIEALLASLDVPVILIESARSLRLQEMPARFGLLPRSERLAGTPSEIIQATLRPDVAAQVVDTVAGAMGLDALGEGSVYVQEVREFAPGADIADILVGDLRDAQVQEPSASMRNLALITCTVAHGGSGDALARLALELGAGVPVITLGTGCGMRDRLGLLRITIPPEKELIHLLVPAPDAEGIMRYLIEQGRLNAPGRGFVYCKPVCRGIFDTTLRVGTQIHPASIEQVIAAIDRLTGGAGWRRRLQEVGDSRTVPLLRKCDEVTLVCGPEHTARFVETAMRVGADGATSMPLRQLRTEHGKGAALERCVMVVPHAISASVVNAILACDESEVALSSLQVNPVTYSYAHHHRPAGESLESSTEPGDLPS